MYLILSTYKCALIDSTTVHLNSNFIGNREVKSFILLLSLMCFIGVLANKEYSYYLKPDHDMGKFFAVVVFCFLCFFGPSYITMPSQ